MKQLGRHCYRPLTKVVIARWRTARVVISLFLPNQSQRISFAVIIYAEAGCRNHQWRVICCNIEYQNFCMHSLRPSNVTVFFPAAILRLSLQRWLGILLPIMSLCVRVCICWRLLRKLLIARRRWRLVLVVLATSVPICWRTLMLVRRHASSGCPPSLQHLPSPPVPNTHHSRRFLARDLTSVELSSLRGYWNILFCFRSHF